MRSLVNKRFGHWVVLAEIKEKRKRATVLCLCDCGTKKEVGRYPIINGHTKSCGACKSQDITNKRFGRWLVTGENPTNKKVAICLCDCGTEREVLKFSLLNGDSKSCGCYQKEHPARKTHGKTKHPLYGIWCHMKNRCADKNYEAYGGRGITVCSEWINDFQSFYDWAIKNNYKKGLTIERSNVNKGYSVLNCSWIPLKEQNRNKRVSLYVTYEKERILLIELCEQLKIPYKLIWERLFKLNWDLERAITTKPQKRNSGSTRPDC